MENGAQNDKICLQNSYFYMDLNAMILITIGASEKYVRNFSVRLIFFIAPYLWSSIEGGSIFQNQYQSFIFHQETKFHQVLLNWDISTFYRIFGQENCESWEF